MFKTGVVNRLFKTQTILIPGGFFTPKKAIKIFKCK